jgi:hypothetical protein
MFNVSTAEKLTITGDIVIEPNDDDTVSTSDLMQRQILGIGGEFRKIHSIPDDADFAFAIVPPHKGDGAIIDTEEDGEEDESAN